VQAKITKLVGLKNGGRVSPINLVTFAGTQNGEFDFWENSSVFQYSFGDISAICWPILMQNSVLETSLVVDYD
jgi:hypothetical protein